MLAKLSTSLKNAYRDWSVASRVESFEGWLDRREDGDAQDRQL